MHARPILTSDTKCVFCDMSEVEVGEKRKGTLRDAYWNPRASNLRHFWTYLHLNGQKRFCGNFFVNKRLRQNFFASERRFERQLLCFGCYLCFSNYFKTKGRCKRTVNTAPHNSARLNLPATCTQASMRELHAFVPLEKIIKSIRTIASIYRIIL